MDFQASLDYLYGLQRFGVKLGLENMRALKARLPLLQSPLPCLHVAGTNGKGSVSVLLAEILKLSGLRVGLYTSPHLHCFSERIRIDGIPVTQHEIAELAETIRTKAEGLPLTFFEATTAMALLAFKKHQVDFAVIETGLGGRLDATNIVEPVLCMLTPISLDHREHLGSSIAEIAAEKAGIIKSSAPVVAGRQLPAAVEVILDAAASHGAEVQLAGRDFSWQGDHGNLTVAVGSHRFAGLSCALPGAHQLDNFAQAVAGAMQLRAQGIRITDAAISLAGRTASWPGRLEWWGEPGKVLLDVAHNQAGVSCLARYLEEQWLSRVHLVTGLSGERDPYEVLMPLEKSAVAVYAVPVPQGQSVSTGQIARWAEGAGVPVGEYQTAAAGFAAALNDAGQDGTVLVCGSLYLVAELRQKLLQGEFSIALEQAESP